MIGFYLMKDNYQQAIAFVFKYEGGYVNNPQDPGGPTNRGITLATAKAFWKKDATIDDIKNMPKAVAEDIYKKQYANKINFDNLPNGIDLCALDASIMSGPSRANKWLLQANTIEEYQALRLNFYKSLKIYTTFGKGWTNRVNACSLLANSMVRNAHNDSSTVSIPSNTITHVNKSTIDTNIKNSKAPYSTNSYIGTNVSVSPEESRRDDEGYSKHLKTQGGLIAIGGTLALALVDYWPYVLSGTAIVMVASYILIKYIQWRHGQAK